MKNKMRSRKRQLYRKWNSVDDDYDDGDDDIVVVVAFLGVEGQIEDF